MEVVKLADESAKSETASTVDLTDANFDPTDYVTDAEHAAEASDAE
jgi:hypothetical protein